MLSSFQSTIGSASQVIPNIDDDFEQACLLIVIEGFKDMKREAHYDLAWKETRFSAHLIGYMQQARERNDLLLRIDPEYHLYHQEVLEGKEDPDTAPRIDIKISGGWAKEDIYYGVEGKVLVENDWGTRDNYQLRTRYIDTGIDNFVSGRYSRDIPRGCILGYVVQGTASEIALKINELLTHHGRASEHLTNRHFINNCPDCYKSRHIRNTDRQVIRLYHVLLTFC